LPVIGLGDLWEGRKPSVSTVSTTKPTASAASPASSVGPVKSSAIGTAGAEAFKEVFGVLQGSGSDAEREGFSDFNGLYIGPYGRGPAGVKPALAPNRFGDVLTTPVVAATLIEYRSNNVIKLKPSKPEALMIYDDALLAIRNGGFPHNEGMTTSYRI